MCHRYSKIGPRFIQLQKGFFIPGFHPQKRPSFPLFYSQKEFPRHDKMTFSGEKIYVDEKSI